MATVIQTPTPTHYNVEGSAVVEAAETWYSAHQHEVAAKQEVKTYSNDRKKAAKTLAKELKAGDTVTIFNNTTMVWVDRRDPSVSYQKVFEGILPHLTPEQSELMLNLLEAHTGDRVVQALKRVK